MKRVASDGHTQEEITGGVADMAGVLRLNLQVLRSSICRDLGEQLTPHLLKFAQNILPATPNNGPRY